MDPRLRIFGIRHHGPGSAASLWRALEHVQPAAVLVEAPRECEDLLPLAAAPGMVPPVALLLHPEKDPARARFYPFDEYSPEWVAICWAIAAGRPVRAIDLPAAAELAGEDVDADAATETAETEQGAEASSPVDDVDDHGLHADPLDALARAAGHSDGEAWWNATVEQRVGGDPLAVFAAVEEAMTAVRADALAQGGAEPERHLRREACMRLRMREALSEFEGDIAVVVGAWHVPALRGVGPWAESSTAAADRKRVKGLPRARIAVTWVPWTEPRLAAGSGYGAGVRSPGWYRHLWRGYRSARTAGGPDERAARWLSLVAHLLREEGLPAATASTIEAVRLARSLAAVRGRPDVGLEELDDACLAALCHGDEAPLRVIRRRLVVGDRVGAVDEAVPQMPLQADLVRQQKAVRLKPEALERDLALDLRSDAGRRRSVLLHRLAGIGVSWGTLIDAEAGRGTFREIWRLRWDPELSVQLAEALRWGTTVEAAAAGAIAEQASTTESIVALAELVRTALLCELPSAVERSLAALQARAATSSDVGALMAAATPLCDVLRYGSAREIPDEPLARLVAGMAAEVAVGLGPGCRGPDDEAAVLLGRSLAGFDERFWVLSSGEGAVGAALGGLVPRWKQALVDLAGDPSAAPNLAGLAARRARDRGLVDPERTEAWMHQALSPGVVPLRAAAWIEGFLGDGGDVLLHDRALLGLLDAWIGEPDADAFDALLPVLRRSFAAFDVSERRRLMQGLGATAASPGPRLPSPDAVGGCVADGFVGALPTLLQILGLPVAGRSGSGADAEGDERD